MTNKKSHDIAVHVETDFLDDQSKPTDNRYVFSYTITIENRGTMAARLLTRHWIITDGNGQIREIRGDGVVGVQPLLGPGEDYEYNSGTVLETSVGTMHGTYRMWCDDGSYFDAVIAPFSLASPASNRDDAN
ncbi:MAG: Co2+/Mg2+ efflux protein ApaG [Dokdonella sp.]